MRRVALLLVLLAAGIGVAIAGCGSSGGDYRVAAVFDTSKGMVAGQLVKVAGARVGRVDDVQLTDDHKARIEMSVDEEFAPFRADARCRILPEGLISENYVECDPGTGGDALADGENGVPTVPLERTTVPVSVQDILNTFDLPTSQRIRVLVAELGLGTAGRGEDLNALLRRANPALTDARAVLTTIADQRREIAAAVGQTDQVLAELAQRREDVRAFLRNAAQAVDTTAAERAPLADAIRRLPPMLDETRAGLRALDAATLAATPLVSDLRDAAPALSGFLEQLPAFSRAGRPAVARLSDAAKRTRALLPDLEPVVSDLDALTHITLPFASKLGRTMIDLRDRGFTEGFESFWYALAVSTSLYDSVSHYFSLFAGVAAHCMVPQHVVPVPGCSHKFSEPRIPVNDPDARPEQARAVARGLRAAPVPKNNPLAAAARQLFLSKKLAPEGVPDPRRIEDLLDYVLG